MTVAFLGIALDSTAANVGAGTVDSDAGKGVVAATDERAFVAVIGVPVAVVAAAVMML